MVLVAPARPTRSYSVDKMIYHSFEFTFQVGMPMVDLFHVHDLPFIENSSAEEFPVALSCLVVGVSIRAS